MIHIEDDFLSDFEFNRIQNQLVYTPDFMWQFCPVTENIGQDDDEQDAFQFVHGMYRNFAPCSQHFQHLESIIKKINPRALIKIKLNLTTRSESIIQGHYHNDLPFDHSVALFYLNTNNGYTLFEDGTKVESVANRIVFFDGSMKHLGTNCTDKQRRLVLNINYL